MTNVPQVPQWSPHTHPVTEGDLQTCPFVVIHYWAAWDGIDREMDKRILALSEEYADRICFRSCDVDRLENRPFIQGIANIPALGCFIRGTWYKSLIGLRREDELRRVFDAWLAAAATPGGPQRIDSAAARIVALARSLTGFGRRG